MNNFLTGLPLFCLVLTIGAFSFGQWCQKKTKSPLCSPILIGALLVIGVLLLTGIDPEDYQSGIEGLSWLLTPATVCLAVPLYRQLKVLKGRLPAILAGITAGTLTSLTVIILMCKLLGLDRQVTVSLMPKSITTAMGIVLSEQNGGISALTAVVIVLTGNLGSLIGSALCKIFKIKDPISQGVAFGTAAHVIGTSRATEIDLLAGAVSGLSLAVAGILTALLFPLFCTLL